MSAAIQILYVDDEPDLLGIGKMFLEESGDFTVTTAISASIALRLLEQEKFDAIISDYQMPGMNGIQFLVEVRARFGPIPFILFTGRGREEIVIQAINSGVDFYLQKGGEPSSQFAELSHKVKSAASRKMAEDALLESRERLKFALEGTNDGIWDVRMDTGAVYLSPRGCEILGYTPEELTLVAQIWSQLVHPDDLPATTAALNAYLEGHVPIFDVEQRLKTKSGNWKWIQVRGKAISRDDNGAPTRMVGTHTDITEQKEVREALNDSEEKFRALIENASDIIRILDREGRIIFDTGASERLLGYPPGFTIGKSPMEFIHPDDLEMVKRELSEVYNSTNTGIPTEFRLKRADGSYTYVESSGKNLIGVQGIDGIVITTRFIDERKKADKALLESEEKYRSILKASPDDITITDLKGVISMVSPASLTTFGYKREEDLVGHSIADFLVPEDRARAADNIALMHQGVFSGPGEYCAIRGNGSTFDIEANGEFIRDACGQPTGMVFIVRDITGRKRAEEKLRQQTDAMEAAIDGLALLNADQNYVYMNRAHAEIYGYANASELVGMSWRILYDSDELQRFEQEIMPELGEKGHYQGRAIGKKKDGSQFPQEISLTALENGGLICVVRDITEGKLAEERLKESEEKFRATIGQSIDGILIADGDFRIIEWNTAQTAIYGYTRDEILGKPLWEFQFATLPEEKRSPVVLEKMKRSMLNLRTSSNSSWMNSLHDFEVRSKDGQLKTVQISTFPIVFLDRIFFGSISRDITDKKQAEKELRESEEQLHNFISNLPVGLYRNMAGPQGKVLMANPFIARMHGYDTLEEFLQKPTADMYAKPEERIAFSDQLISKGSIFGREIHLKRKNNELFWGRISAVAVRNQQGDVQYFDGFIEDITDKKRAEEALQLANKKLNILSSITRHDINNQLVVLLGYLTILQKKQPDPALNEYFQNTTTAAQRIANMIQFTREYEDIGVKAPAWQDCRTLVDTATKQATLGQVMVKNDLTAGMEVFADPLIVKVFYNLMDNAIRYGGKITTIQFSVQEAGDCHLIVCKDDGEGIPADEKEKIFERGFGKNTGLGLALSKEILSITDISIKETGEPGKGARFEMTVPKGAWRIIGTDDR